MIRSAERRADGVFLMFSDGVEGVVSWRALGLDPTVSQAVRSFPWHLTVWDGAAFWDFPWDYLRSLVDPEFLEIERARAQGVRLALRERLRARREAAGLSQEELAARCGVSPETVQAWEEGRLSLSCRDLARLNRAGFGL